MNYEELKKLYEDLALEITHSEKEYKSFLSTTAHHYARGFANKLLIYKNRPDATVLSQYHGWKAVQRHVKAGAHGIKLFSNFAKNTAVFFTIQDTEANSPENEFIAKSEWQLTSENTAEVLNLFSASAGKTYLDLQEYNSKTIVALLSTNFEKFITKHYPDLGALPCKIEEIFDLQIAITIFMVNSRLGLPVDDISFANLSNFKTLNDAIFLGSSTTFLAAEILKTYENTVPLANANIVKFASAKSKKSTEQDIGAMLEQIAEEAEESIESVSIEDITEQPNFLGFVEEPSAKIEAQTPEFNRTQTLNATSDQLSLFDLPITENSGDKEPTAISGSYFFKISDEDLNTILRSGGNRKYSRMRIYEQYARKNSPEKVIEFLKAEYGITGNGFTFGDKKYAVWFDENGLTIGQSASAFKHIANKLDWGEIESRIRSLVMAGDYLSQQEQELCEDIVKREILSHFNFAIRDQNFITIENFCENLGYVPKTDENGEPYKYINHQEATDFFISLTESKEGVRSMLNLAEEILSQGKEIFEYKISYDNLQKSVSQIYDFLLDFVQFPASENVNIKLTDFITDDLIKSSICRKGSGKFRIYEFFTEPHPLNEQIAFLRKEYGIGGSSHALPGCDYSSEHHNYTGIRFIHNDVEISLKWSKIAKIISELISQNQYLSDTELSEYKDLIYEKLADEAAYEDPDAVLFIGGNENDFIEYNEYEWDFEEPLTSETGENNQVEISKVEIPFSEHPALARADLKELDFATANKLLGILDMQEAGKEQGYYKTDFKFTVTINGEPFEYEGRYDLGDGETDLVSHIQFYYQELVKPISYWYKSAQQDNSLEQYLSDNYYVLDTIIPLLKAAANDPDEKVIADVIASLHTDEVIKTETEAVYDAAEALTIAEEETNASDLQFFDFPQTAESNYVIPDFLEYSTYPSEKFEQNIAAIKLIKSGKTQFTEEEKNILALYSGWGGLSNVFNENPDSYWSKKHLELKELLSSKEYESARSSCLTAFYTDKPVINFIYKALRQMGVKPGSIFLEPSLGCGNFLGLCPEDLDAKFVGTELDTISGRIAQILYPQSKIFIDGYETLNIPNNSVDVAIGNIPFGDFKVYDPKYNKENFLIHDYFFAKTLDKVKPGGIIAFITSTGTLDKATTKTREYLAERAELITAIRLPSSAFKAAGTSITSDIIFLQKRLSPITLTKDNIPNWVKTSANPHGFILNNHYVEHPRLLLGSLRLNTRYGTDYSNHELTPFVNVSLATSLDAAFLTLRNQFDRVKIPTIEITTATNTDSSRISVDSVEESIKDFTFGVVDEKIYFREGPHLIEQETKHAERIMAFCKLRNALRASLDAQAVGCSDEDLSDLLRNLNEAYDDFYKKYGSLNSKQNSAVFSNDSDKPLLQSLEVIDPDTEAISKAPVFSKRVIDFRQEITKVDTAEEGLFVSMNVKGFVDISYIASLYGKSETDVVEELDNLIYLEPTLEDYSDAQIHDTAYLAKCRYVLADEYLSGNIYNKIALVNVICSARPELAQIFEKNLHSLEKVLPEKLSAADIQVKLGVSWVDLNDYEKFMYNLFNTPRYVQDQVRICYNDFLNEWTIINKTRDASATVTNTYGTSRMNAYQILEASLNQKEAIVRDRIEYDDDKVKYVINPEETEQAKIKQTEIQEAFRDWLFADSDRRAKYEEKYNRLFNAIRLREYDGSYQTFPGINSEINLEPHQKAAIARIKYTGNTLLAHSVGAGKTFEFIAAVMEKKRLGLIHKACVVVPNHLTGQTAVEWLRLYPQAELLVATKKDFEKQNRLRFISKMATGNYDAVILGYSQFDKIPMGIEYQADALTQDLHKLTFAIEELRRNAYSSDRQRSNYSVKSLERVRKSLQTRLQALYDDSKQDDLLTFEQLGFDQLVVDEAHNYKNCALFTKMNNVAGISDTGAKKSFDLLQKCKWLNEKTGYSGIIFATGTPVSNSMSELYTMTNYLRPDLLREQGLEYFDNWAAQYGEVVSRLELAPSGKGYRIRKRFAKFVNLPELLTVYKTFADVQTAKMLNLPVPALKGGKPITISVDVNELQAEYIDFLAERMEKIHGGSVDPAKDNALKITHEARMLGTDTRLIIPDSPNDPNSKVNVMIDNVAEIYEKCKNQETQLIFCDIGTPKAAPSETFILYDYIKEELIKRGIPAEEIAFAHDAKTEAQKMAQYNALRAGKLRIVIASTAKMGTGANVQDKLIALHHIDIPWKPSDLEQRNGRILRQGNANEEVAIYQYVTKGSFDSYMWSILENKQTFISQLQTINPGVRECEDLDEMVLNYAEVKAIASGDDRIKEKMELDIEVKRLQMLKSAYKKGIYDMHHKIEHLIPESIRHSEKKIEVLKEDLAILDANPIDDFCMTIKGVPVTDRKDAGTYIQNNRDNARALGMSSATSYEIGQYRGLKVYLDYTIADGFQNAKYRLIVSGKSSHYLDISESTYGTIIKLENVVAGFAEELETWERKLVSLNQDLENLKIEVTKPFSLENELREKLNRQVQLNAELDLDKKDDVIITQELAENSNPKNIDENDVAFEEYSVDEKSLIEFKKSKNSPRL